MGIAIYENIAVVLVNQYLLISCLSIHDSRPSKRLCLLTAQELGKAPLYPNVSYTYQTGRRQGTFGGFLKF